MFPPSRTRRALGKQCEKPWKTAVSTPVVRGNQRDSQAVDKVIRQPIGHQPKT
jgi:hypothetical protein